MWISHIAGRTAAATGIYFNQEFDKDRGHLIAPRGQEQKSQIKKEKNNKNKKEQIHLTHNMLVVYWQRGFLSVSPGCTLITNTVPPPLLERAAAVAENTRVSTPDNATEATRRN